jgi:hypothetical protein
MTYGEAELKIDPTNGCIIAAMIGGKGEYKLNFYINGEFYINFATCMDNLREINLTPKARAEGWIQDQIKFFPPQSIIARILRSADAERHLEFL